MSGVGVSPEAAMTGDVDMSLHPSGIIPELQNVVSTVNLGCSLELKEIAMQARNAEYNPKRFAAVIMRIRDPKTTALIFGSGKMVCTGAKSEQDSRTAARKYAKIVQKLGFPAKFMDFKIQNIVGSCDVKFPIRLEPLAYQHQQFCSYEPELFPGLIYRMLQPKIVLLIFVSGKVVLTGAKERTEIYRAFEQIYPVLTQFRKGDSELHPDGPPIMPPPPARLPRKAVLPLKSNQLQQQDSGDPTGQVRSTPDSIAITPNSNGGIPPPSPQGGTPSMGGPSGIPPPSPAMHPSGSMIPPPSPAMNVGGSGSIIPPPSPALGAAAGGSGMIPPPSPLGTMIPPPSPIPSGINGIPPPSPWGRGD
eukprot:TRINITY_DN4037_c0_g2_i2.p1 TRINITY_DN4037_c0_g2~~TRINITY_DN4037_c0_g2_i2.p1  ORF type:complete len:395 (+),score=65.02 TRINITY_DN4037_c0_g2_i2:100-1185(+)